MAQPAKCLLHIPHKNVDAYLLLSPDLDPSQRKRRVIEIEAEIRENWSSIERWVNEIAPGCFGGGEGGCGVPGPHVPNIEPVANGENACAEGDGTIADGDQSVVMGKDNEITELGTNSVIAGGHDNLIENDGPNPAGNNVIAGGYNNHIQASENGVILGGHDNEITEFGNDDSAVGGQGNSVQASDSLVYGTNNITRAIECAVFGNNNIAESTGGGSADSLVHGYGAVSWLTGQQAHSSNSSPFDTGVDGFRAGWGQYSRTSWNEIVDSGGVGDLFGGNLYIVDFNAAYHIYGTVVLRHDLADIVSCWSFDCVVSALTSGGARFVGTPTITLIAQDAGAAAWTFDLNIAGSGPAIIEGNATVDVDSVYTTATVNLDEVYVAV